MHGEAKAKAVVEVAAENGVDLADSLAYSDSINDLPLLESVGYPHAVNPEGELRRIALQKGWPIHELRTRGRRVVDRDTGRPGRRDRLRVRHRAGRVARTPAIERRRDIGAGAATARQEIGPVAPRGEASLLR